MTVKKLMDRLKEFNENAEIKIQYYDPDSLYMQTLPADNIRDIYNGEDKEWPREDIVIFDIWTFSY